MGEMRVRWAVPLAAAAIVVGGGAALGALSDNFTSPAAPVPSPGGAPATYLAMTGAKTGPFTGGVVSKGHKAQIQVIGLDLGLTSPRDQQTGLPTGRTVCDGLNFRKPTDRATPLLFSAAASNEILSKAVFTEYGPGSSGAGGVGSVVPHLVITLLNSSIAKLHHVDAITTGAYDDVTLMPQSVTVAWPQSNVKSTFSCTSQPG